MNISIPYVAGLLALLLMVGMLRRHWLLSAWTVFVLVFPTAIVKIAGAPIYLYDLVAVLLIGVFSLNGDFSRWPRGMPRWHFWLVIPAFFLSVVGGVIRYGMVPEIFWLWGHSSLAWMAFAVAVIATTSAGRNEYRNSLQWGILFSSLVLSGIAIIQFADLPGSDKFAPFFYGDLGRVEGVEILRQGIETNRANGPHSAPPALAGMALLSIIVFWLVTDQRHRLARWLVLLSSTATVLCTVSRHAMLAGILGLIVILFMSEARARAKLFSTTAVLGVLLALAAAGSLLRESWAHRLEKTNDGVLSDDNIAARVLWGPTRLATVIAHEPSILLTGAGLDPEKLDAKSKLDADFETGFVSNGFLLPLYYLGVFGFGIFGLFWLWASKMALHSPPATRGAMCGFVVMSVVLVVSDNYGFMYEPAVGLLFLIVGLIAGQRHLELVQARLAEEPEFPTDSVTGVDDKEGIYAH